MLTTAELTELLTTRPTPAWRGRVLFHHQAARRPRSDYPVSQRRLIEALVAGGTISREQYQHPETAAFRIVAASPSQKVYELTDSDRLWISRLPSSDAVTYDDAVALAQLARQVDRRSADRRLLDSIWAPVKARHDRAAAEVEVRNQRQSWPALPTGGWPYAALFDAVRVETTELSDEECQERARRVTKDIEALRDQHQHRDVQKAEQVLTAIDEQVARREALTA